MNLNETNVFDYFNASNKISRIPRFLNKFVNNIKFEENDKSINKSIGFKKEFNSLNLNGKQSRIPVFKSRKSCVKYNEENEQKNRKHEILIKKSSENRFEDNLQKFTNYCESNDNLKVNLRPIVGRSASEKGWTQSEPIDCLKFILEIVRSDISAEKKFRAIKRYRDKRLGIVSQMENYSDNTFDDKVREWVDSGYMSSVGQHDEVFNANESKCGASVSTSNPVVNPKDIGIRRRSYNNMRAMDLIALNNKYNSFNSDISLSSISSIESLLESRREDPEELLLSLGFGYVPEDQTLNRIPQRFLESPSSAKGVNPENFRKVYGHKDSPSLSSSVSFPSTDFRERSYSCGRVSERFKKRMNSKESLMKQDLPEIITSSCSPVLQTESILNPANRKFLESQGKQDQPNQLSSKRLIIGTKSYKLDIDGDPLAFPKTPSPVATTPVPTDNEMDVCPEPTDEQTLLDTNDDNFCQTFKRKQLQRQNRISDNDLHFDDSTVKCSMTDMSSDLSSSTTTLVGTVMSSSNEMPINSNDYFESIDKHNAFAQTDKDLTQKQNNKAIEAALVVAIQSLRLSLEFYRHQSLKLAKISTQKYNESYSVLSENDLFSLSKIHELRECIHKEIVDMDIVLNRHLQVLHTCDVVDMSFISQAQVFTEAVKKVKQLLKEQQKIYSKMGLIEAEHY